MEGDRPNSNSEINVDHRDDSDEPWLQLRQHDPFSGVALRDRPVSIPL